MYGSCGNVAALAGAIGLRLAVQGESHFTAQNDVRGFRATGVIGVEGVRAILPNVGVRESFLM